MTQQGEVAATGYNLNLDVLIDVLRDLYEDVSRRLLSAEASIPLCLLFCGGAEGDDFDPTALSSRLRHAALCSAEMLIFLFAIAFFKRFFNFEVIVGGWRGDNDVGQRSLLFDNAKENSVDESRSSLLPPHTTDYDKNGGAIGHASDYDGSRDSSVASCTREMVRARPESPSIGSSSSSSAASDISSDTTSLSSVDVADAAEAEADAEDSKGCSRASSVPSSSAQVSAAMSTVATSDIGVHTFDSNHLAASSQYDRSEVEEDGDDDAASFFDNDPVVTASTAEARKRSRSCDNDDDDEDVLGLEDNEEDRAQEPTFGSVDSNVSWFQEHYGRVWIDDDEVESEWPVSESDSDQQAER
jgi:hypothetical protein